MNKNSEAILAALAPTLATMTPVQRQITETIVKHGPIRGAEIGKRFDRDPGFAGGHIGAIRWRLRDVAEIIAGNGAASKGYRLRLLPGIQASEAVPQVAVPQAQPAAAPSEPSPAEPSSNNGAAPPAKRSRERRFYTCPWPGGTFDLDQVTAVSVSQSGQLVLQLLGGAFVRGPVHDDVPAVAEDIERVLASLHADTSYSFRERARSGEAFPGATRQGPKAVGS